MDEKATHSDLATATDAADRWRELVNSSNDEKLIRDNYKALLQQQLAVLQERVNALNDTLSAIQYVNPILVEPLDRGPGLLSALRRQGEEIKALRKFEPALLDGPVAIQHNGNHARSWTRIVLACAETAWAPLILTGSVKLPEGLELDIIRRCLNGYDSSRVRVNLNIEFDGLSNKIRSGHFLLPAADGGTTDLASGKDLERPEKSLIWDRETWVSVCTNGQKILKEAGHPPAPEETYSEYRTKTVKKYHDLTLSLPTSWSSEENWSAGELSEVRNALSTRWIMHFTDNPGSFLIMDCIGWLATEGQKTLCRGESTHALLIAVRRNYYSIPDANSEPDEFIEYLERVDIGGSPVPIAEFIDGKHIKTWEPFVLSDWNGKPDGGPPPPPKTLPFGLIVDADKMTIKRRGKNYRSTVLEWQAHPEKWSAMEELLKAHPEKVNSEAICGNKNSRSQLKSTMNQDLERLDVQIVRGVWKLHTIEKIEKWTQVD